MQICNHQSTQLRFTYYLFLIFNIRLRLSKTVKPYAIGRLLVTNQSTRYSFFFLVCLAAIYDNNAEEMPGKCSFQDIWLQKPEFKDWLVKVKEGNSSAQCSLCKKRLSIANSGVSQVISHSTGAKHKSSICSKVQTRGSHFSVGSSFVRC